MFYSFGIRIMPWQNEFGWSRAEIGIAQTIATILLIFAVPAAGKAIDRFGVKRIATLSMVLFSATPFLGAKVANSLMAIYLLPPCSH